MTQVDEVEGTVDEATAEDEEGISGVEAHGVEVEVVVVSTAEIGMATGQDPTAMTTGTTTVLRIQEDTGTRTKARIAAEATAAVRVAQGRTAEAAAAAMTATVTAAGLLHPRDPTPLAAGVHDDKHTLFKNMSSLL